MSRSAVFLDRDGVLNDYVYHAEFGTVDSPANPDEFSLAEGVPNALAALRELGYVLIVVSNQPGVAKGRFSSELLGDVTTTMQRLCLHQLDAIYYCLHHPQAILPEYRQECACRKPRPGLLLQAANDWDVDLASSYMVGDGITDIAAGIAAGTKTIFRGTRKCYVCAEFRNQRVRPDYIAERIQDVVDIVAGRSQSRHLPCEV